MVDWNSWARGESEEEEESTTALIPLRGELGEPFRRWEPPREEPEVVEGEFRAVSEEELLEEEPREGILGWISRRTGGRPRGMIQEEWEEEQKRGEAARRIEELERGIERRRELGIRISREKLETELEELRKERRKFRRQYRPSIPGVAKKLQLIGTLGGVPMTPAARRELYFGKPGRGLYGAAGMRPLTAPPGRESLIAETLMPRLEILKRAIAPPPTERIRRPFVGLAKQEGLGPALARLREVSKLPVTRVEHAALEEIKANGDRDTLQHVSSELAELGIPKVEAERAVKGLLEKGLVRKIREAPGERPIYEVVGR